MFNLQNKTAIITGAGSGIGKAIALTFSKQNANIAILDFNIQAAQETADQINTDRPNTAIAIQTDVTDQAQVQTAFAATIEKFNTIDILVNNAGIGHVGNVQNTTPQDLDKIYNVNVKGAYNCLQAAVNQMVTQKGGVILNLASIASIVGIEDRFAYSMSKGAVLTMTYSIATDYVKQNIRCNCVCPARIHTPFVDQYLAKNYPDNTPEMFKKLSDYQPVGRMGTPEEVAALALYLCSDEAAFITGAAYPIDGGVTNLTYS